MRKISRDGAALFLAGIIVVNAIFNMLYPEVRLREYVATFFYRQMDILAVMGGNISKQGIATAVSKFFSPWDQGEHSVYPVWTETRMD